MRKPVTLLFEVNMSFRTMNSKVLFFDDKRWGDENGSGEWEAVDGVVYVQVWPKARMQVAGSEVQDAYREWMKQKVNEVMFEEAAT